MKNFKRLMLLVLCLAAVFSMTGCADIKEKILEHLPEPIQEEEGAGYNIYYVNDDETQIRGFSYQIQATSEEGIIDECLSVLGQDSGHKGYGPVLNDTVKINKYKYKKDSALLALYFDKGYSSLSMTTERLVRTAIVKTLTQFVGVIDYVVINVDGQWIMDDEGNKLRMKSDDYVISITSNIEDIQDGEFVLYCVDESGEYLEETVVKQKYYTSVPVEKVIIENLINCPNGYKKVISDRVRVKSVYNKDGVCTIDFNDYFLTKISDCDFKLNVYSVINSLTALSHIQRVQITVNGDILTDVPDDVDISKPRAALYEFVKTEEELETQNMEN